MTARANGLRDVRRDGGDAARSTTVTVSTKGRLVEHPALDIGPATVFISGHWLRIAAIHDEDWTEREPGHIDACLHALTTMKRADVFAFTQPLPDLEPQWRYPFELVYMAAMPITTYETWWNTRLSHDTRKIIRRSAKRGVSVRAVPFDDALVTGIQAIYDECPVRQGKPFWHYRKSFEAVKNENATYLDRSLFLGAYHDEELIGFLKLVRVGRIAHTMQVLSMMKHHEKRPTNALIAAAVDQCARMGISYLSYGEYRNRHRETSLTHFKKLNGFEEFAVPRFFAPLTRRGRLALALGVHRDLVRRIPPGMVQVLLAMRTRWTQLRHSTVT